MIYFTHISENPFFWFGLERDLLQSKDLKDDIFLFWRTEPSLMLGRYQNATAEIDEAYAKQRGISIVRRLSGGGTIYTDPGSWQFSFIRREQEKRIDFESFVRPVLNALRQMGFDAYKSERNDLLIDGKKFCGNAQYHCAGRVLHHGSLLFGTDLEEMARTLTVGSDKLRAKGIRSVRQRVANLRDYMAEPTDANGFRDLLLAQLLPGSVERRVLAPEDVSRIEREHASMFRSWDWVFGESPEYEIVKSKRLPGGKVEIRLNLEKGIIQDCDITGDFFFAGDLHAITDPLCGCLFDRQHVREALIRAQESGSFYQINLDELLACMF